MALPLLSLGAERLSLGAEQCGTVRNNAERREAAGIGVAAVVPDGPVAGRAHWRRTRRGRGRPGTSRTDPGRPPHPTPCHCHQRSESALFTGLHRLAEHVNPSNCNARAHRRTTLPRHWSTGESRHHRSYPLSPAIGPPARESALRSGRFRTALQALLTRQKPESSLPPWGRSPGRHPPTRRPPSNTGTTPGKARRVDSPSSDPPVPGSARDGSRATPGVARPRENHSSTIRYPSTPAPPIDSRTPVADSSGLYVDTRCSGDLPGSRPGPVIRNRSGIRRDSNEALPQ